MILFFLLLLNIYTIKLYYIDLLIEILYFINVNFLKKKKTKQNQDLILFQCVRIIVI